MSINSKQKGSRGEREVSKILTEAGFPASRSQQYKGSVDSADLDCESLEHLHFEVKFVERLSLYKAMKQAREDAGPKIPVVVHRKKREDWLAVLPLSDFLQMQQQLGYAVRSEE